MSSNRLPPAVAFEAAENVGSNTTSGPTMGDLIAERLSRRDLVKGLAAVTVATELIWPGALSAAPGLAEPRPSQPVLLHRTLRDAGLANSPRC